MFQVGKDVKVRKLTNAEAGYAGFDHRVTAIAAETPFRLMQNLTAPDAEVPICTGASDALMRLEVAYLGGPASAGEIAGRCAGIERS